MRLPFGNRAPKPPPPPSADLPAGEEVERATKATLLYGKEEKKGILHMTNRRLLFEAKKGEARWMSVPYDEILSAGLYRWPGAPMGLPSSKAQCLVIETEKGEQVWWDFNEKEEREWLPIVQSHLSRREASADEEQD